MPKRKHADQALTSDPLTVHAPTLQTVIDATPDLQRPRLFPAPRIGDPLHDDAKYSLPTLDDDTDGLDVDIDEDCIDPRLLDGDYIDTQAANLPSCSTPSTLIDIPEDDSEKQLVNDYQSIEQHARPYVCKFDGCDKAFARKSDLARHFRIHTNERGCGKSFIQRSALTVHHRVHTGERPHTCEICHKAFADSSSLARHRRIHTGSKPYACTVDDCDRAFARRNSYLKHHQREHPDEPTPTATIPRAPALPPPFTAYRHVLRGRKSWSSRSVSAPHGFAAPHPSEGAAYLPDGFAEYRIGGGTGGDVEYNVARVGGGLTTTKPYRFPARNNDDATTKKGRGGNRTVSAIAAPASAAPQSLGKGRPRDPSPQPSLSSDDSHVDGDDEDGRDYVDEQPGTPLLAVPLTSTTATFSESGSTGALHVGTGLFTGAPSLHSARSDGLGTGPLVEGQQLGVYGTALSPKHQIPRQAPSSSLNLDRNDISRSVSNPDLRSPFTSAPWVGGGFSASQLSIPPGHLTGSYYPPLPATTGNTPLHTAVQSPVDRPERRLTDPDVPSFTFQAPGGQAVTVPVSAIQSNSFPALNTPIQPIVPSQEQPQTAPPTLTRFNSAPSMPTRNAAGINVNEWLSTSTGPSMHDPLTAHDTTSRFPMLPSVSATLSAIADQSPLTSMASEAPGTAPLPQSSTLPPSATIPTFASPASASPATGQGHWGPPINFPAPPRPSVNTMPPPQYPPPTPALTSGATAPMYSQSHGLAPISHTELYTPAHTNYYAPPTPANPHAGWTLAPKHKSPLPYYKPYHPQAPYSAHPGLYNGQLSPFTPITAQSHVSAGYQYPMSQTPQHFSYSPLPMRHEQTITLSSPPRGRVDRNVSGMSGIGLGLANVSFGDRSTSITGAPGGLMTGNPYHPASQPNEQPVQAEMVAQPAARQPLHPMLPPQIQHPPPPKQVVHDTRDVQMEVSSSEEEDDEYVPSGRKAKRGAKKGTKTLKAKGAGAVSRAKGRSV